jgi:hypothetical protein
MVAHVVVDHITVEIDFAGVLGLEGADFEVYHHKASKPQVIKLQIDIKIIFGYIKMNLATHKRKD